jgi:transposase
MLGFLNTGARDATASASRPIQTGKRKNSQRNRSPGIADVQPEQAGCYPRVAQARSSYSPNRASLGRIADHGASYHQERRRRSAEDCAPEQSRSSPSTDPRALSRCRGSLVRMHKELVAQGARFSYPSLTHFVRRERIREAKSDVSHTQSNATQSIATAKEWLAEITYGWRPTRILTTEFKDPSALATLLKIVRNGTLRERKKAATILARKRGIPNTVIAKILHASGRTTRRYFKVYREAGAAGLFSGEPRLGKPAKHAEITNRILELLHCRPDSIGFNRMNWTQRDLIQAYEARHHETISRSTLARLIKKAGYGWRKARRVLTSPDPNYQEKVELLVTTLRSPTASEMFFFIDEWGPSQVRKRGGRA